MRTTIEITDEQHQALIALAQRGGLRGLSPVVQEALDAYLRDLNTEETDLLLGLEGALSDAEEAEMRSRIKAMRTVWRAS